MVGVFWAYPNAEVAGASRLGLLKGLAELGYIPGSTFILEERYAGDVPERFDTVAAELIALKVDVVVSQGGAPAAVLHRKTSTIPVVAVGIGDPIAQGLAASLSKPGGNVTGVSQMSADTAGKRLQLLKETSLTALRVALLRDPTNAGAASELSQYPSAAKELGVSYDVFDASTGIDIDQAFQRMEEQHLQAAVVFNAAFFNSERKRISALGLRYRLALMGPNKYFIEAGSLMSYGPDYPTLWHDAAHFVDKILRGERVGDIPIQQPTRFYFCINLRTAKVLGIEIPPAMLAFANEVIE